MTVNPPDNFKDPDGFGGELPDYWKEEAFINHAGTTHIIRCNSNCPVCFPPKTIEIDKFPEIPREHLDRMREKLKGLADIHGTFRGRLICGFQWESNSMFHTCDKPPHGEEVKHSCLVVIDVTGLDKNLPEFIEGRIEYPS